MSRPGGLSPPVRVRWKRLHNIYRDRGIVLALGSGVSVGSGLPNWNGLLQRLAEPVEDRADTDLFNELRKTGIALPVVASILEKRCPDRTEFIERVRTALYRDFRFFRSELTQTDRRALVDHVWKHNPTLRAVASLCADGHCAGGDYSPNRKIHAVVTFNLDNLIREYMFSRYGQRLLRTVERPSASSNPAKISIYQMHGLVRFDRKAHDPTKEAPDAAVLTEQDYFDFFNNPMSLFNYTFMYLLREYTCLFVGLSMHDENIRRLLHFSKMERLRGFKSERVTPDSEKLDRHFAVLQRSIPEVDRALDESLIALGANALWIDDHREIPDELRELYEDGGGDWRLVF